MDEDRMGLDLFRDIPAAYAVFQVIMDQEGRYAQDTRYVYVNQRYCEVCCKKPEEMLGHRFFEVFPQGNPVWMEYCRQALVDQVELRNSLYEKAVGHWLDFAVKPLGRDNLVAFIFIIADRSWEERAAMSRGKMTDDVILEISKILSNEEDYAASMDHALAALSAVIHPDRLYILETDRKTVTNTFEWCAPGVTPEIHTLQHLPYREYIAGWEPLLERDTCVLIEDIEMLKHHDPIDYANLKRQGIKRLMAAPFFHEGELVGYLGADNYEITELLNTREVLEAVSYFMGAKVVNQALVKKLEKISHTDALTGIHNRAALEEKVEELAALHAPVGIVYGDVNGLKDTNDRYGHRAGDDLIRRAVETLATWFPWKGLYREGGDEFLSLSVGMGEEDFNQRAAGLRKELAHRADLSMALGILWLGDSAHIQKALRQVDKAMYQEKAAYYIIHDRRRNSHKPPEE